MRRLLPLLCLILLLNGCAAIEVAQRPESFAACTAADVATTIYAVHTGLAYEANPLLSGSVNAHRFLPLILAKIAVIGFIVYLWLEWREETKYGIAGATAITCGVAANNGLIILKGIRP